MTIVPFKNHFHLEMKINLAEVVDFLFCGLEMMSRRDCGLILAGLRVSDSQRRANQLLRRLERRGFLQRSGRGGQAHFTITAAAMKKRPRLQPVQQWNSVWDGKWRCLTYDLPERRRKDRTLLWRELHRNNFGLLQRSVWVWPHDTQSILEQIIKSGGIPKCFCGFVVERLFLCTNEEIVNAAWDFDKIKEHHRLYLRKASGFTKSLAQGRDLEGLAKLARSEREAYEDAFFGDPLLPRALWPGKYLGPEVEARHLKFRGDLQQQAQRMTRKVTF